MLTLNEATVLGRLGRDPELRYTKEGTAIANLSIATEEGYKDKSGEWVGRTEWHRAVIFGRMAERTAEKCRKGDVILVKGVLETTQWVSKKSGEKHYQTQIKAFKVIHLDCTGDIDPEAARQCAPDPAADCSGNPDDVPF
ncbi:single-stranded DNA-binding protein [Oceanidesulfovibrio marinus]|nr:single-stranded DNA-binding protein [Oceanidesulfovibrio marinus]